MNDFEDLGCDPQTAIAVMERVNALLLARDPGSADSLLSEFPELKAALFAHEPEGD